MFQTSERGEKGGRQAQMRICFHMVTNRRVAGHPREEVGHLREDTVPSNHMGDLKPIAPK
jgi:hypothetical protein